MSTKNTEIWAAWYPKAGMTGIYFGRGQLDSTDQLLVHAAPATLKIEVYDAELNLIAKGDDLAATQDSPICLLRREGNKVTREDIWPDADHIGLPLLLPGGEVAILKKWWHAADKKEWRWQVEFYNCVRE